MVFVTDEEGNVVADIEFNSKLDHWDGHNMSSGSPGRHLGITKLRSGQYVLIYGTQWEGEQDTAKTVTDEAALEAIVKSGHIEILDQPKYARLRELWAQTSSEEYEDE